MLFGPDRPRLAQPWYAGPDPVHGVLSNRWAALPMSAGTPLQVSRVLDKFINTFIFNRLQDDGRPRTATLRDAQELTERAVIDMVIFAPLTGSDRAFEPNQHRADAVGQKRDRQFVRCARSSVG